MPVENVIKTKRQLLIDNSTEMDVMAIIANEPAVFILVHKISNFSELVF